MFSDDDLRIILNYLSIVTGRTFLSIDDLMALSTEEFLDLTGTISDEALPIVVSLFKSTMRGSELFHKLTQDLDESTGKRAAAFLKRYMDLVLTRDNTGGTSGNPLLVYLPPGYFDDLAFIQSRQSFFLRQTIGTINEFLRTACGCPVTFGPIQQEEAWKWFWNYLLRK
jgi:hypothetical protein